MGKRWVSCIFEDTKFLDLIELSGLGISPKLYAVKQTRTRTMGGPKMDSVEVDLGSLCW